MILNIIIFLLAIIIGFLINKKNNKFYKKIKDIKVDIVKSFIITIIPLIIFDKTLPLISIYNIYNSVIGKGIIVASSFIFYHLYIEPFTTIF
jgi:hypothetical protein